MSELAIEIKGLSKVYKKTKKSPEKEALKNVDLQIKKGSFFGLLGPNGAGKTTTFYMIVGLVPATAGREEILNAMDGHIIGKNVYIGRFSKPGPLSAPVESSF